MTKHMATNELINAVTAAMEQERNVHYTLGYLKCTLAQIIDLLPEADRDREIRMLRRELDHLTKKEAA